MRGEKFEAKVKGGANEGSPPRARGKDSIPIDGLAESRITPACAGKSVKEPHWPGTQEDHPRVRGEKDRG